MEYDSHHNLKHNRKFCLGLQASVQDPAGHFSRIDKAFAPILMGYFRGKVSEDAVRNRFRVALCRSVLVGA